MQPRAAAMIRVGYRLTADRADGRSSIATRSGLEPRQGFTITLIDSRSFIAR
jgi:hypothetical protein